MNSTPSPQTAAAWVHLGNELAEKGDPEQALRCFLSAIQLDPKFAPAHGSAARMLLQQEKWDEVESHARKAIELDPKIPQPKVFLAKVHLQRKQPDLAEPLCREAIQLNPGYDNAHHHLGLALMRQKRYVESIESFSNALRLNPNFAPALNGLAQSLMTLGRWNQAKEILEVAIRNNPQNAEAHFNLGFVHLLHGDFDRGWGEYEWRFQLPQFSVLKGDKPLWNGESFTGKTLLVRGEQGFGDSIMFARYLRELKTRGGRVIFEVPAQTLSILRQLEGADDVVARGTTLPDFDLQVYLLSLPRIFRTNASTIPAQAPSLRADPKLVERWKEKIPRDSRRRIGLVWQGNPQHGADDLRSVPLELLRPLASVPNLCFYSLQKQETRDREKFTTWFGGRDLAHEIQDFSDTAAILENLDLLISVDTAPIHLAGAMGKQVWALIQTVPDWRWMLERETSPWYPTLRLFRQKVGQDWSQVIARVAQELIPRN